MDIAKAQQALQEARIPGWLLYSFQGSNVLALEALGLRSRMLSRRFAYLIPAQGEPVLIVHAIEKTSFPDLPGQWVVFSSWEQFSRALQTHVAPLGRIAMEYYPGGGIPYLSRIDAGTLELLRGMGLEVVSSAEILLQFQTWTPANLAAHKRAAAGISAALEHALGFVRARLDQPPSELEVQAEISKVFEAKGLVFDHPPMVAYGPNAAKPHHTVGESRLERGQVMLVDLWCKEPEGPYADVTWMAGWEVSDEIQKAWTVVREARNAALAFCQQAYAAHRLPRGFELDRAARQVIEQAGLGAYILHRTGHHLGFSATHGNGTHLDDLETHDTRPLIPGLAFTIEPGVYPGPFGIRSEINVYLHPTGPEVTTKVQEAIEPL
ncbi:M24 family metallopeptidase [Meiothermus hypogaeus]|uniref:Peptidase M24 n=2 Tax=Meiothermus hypogaeus TaxID=884155 RepID=A0A511R494_9DEIN|nr:Xaa-Pro peptidase family protein [Meiothermus hypogaeus]RIH75254.1 putative peptidase [Meiothermus hypogaeus]GEM84430.1 peptidase M24 [Meiothermus hypogaeus NBRC 106114]